MKESMRARVWIALYHRIPLTATDLADRLNVKLSSLSSLLKKMCDEGVIAREKGVGPRGGYGYTRL